MPYADLAPELTHRTNVDVHRKDLDYLKSICPDKGLVTFIVQTAIKSTVDYARTHSLAYGDSDRLIAFVKSSGLRDCAVASAFASAGARDERGAAEGIHQHSSHSTSKPANLQQASKSRRDKIRDGAKKFQVEKQGGTGTEG